MVELLTDQAILLKKLAYGDKDWIVTLFTERLGRLDGIAKGGRVSRRRFGTSLDIGAELSVRFRRKPHQELVFLEEGRLLSPDPVWRRSWWTLVAASYALELVTRLLPAQQAAAEKFRELSSLFRNLRESEAAEQLLRFETAWLSLSGWGDRLDVCGMCGYHPPVSEPELRRQRTLFDHYWMHLSSKPFKSRGLLDPLFSGSLSTHARLP